MSAEVIAARNDAFRSSLGDCQLPGRVCLTRRVALLPEDRLGRILHLVTTFSAWSERNDPFKEHDCGRVTDEGEDLLWKFDYYESAEMEFGAEDGCECFRVLTVMFADEY